ncbi:MAG: CsgG/HfaB family protein [Reinekea sp.]
MKKGILAIALPALLATGCATSPSQLKDVEAPVSETTQAAAQAELFAQPTHLALKRKVAVARLSNETTYGKSLLSGNAPEKMAQKVSDMFVQGLTNSGNYLIFERPDLDSLQAESVLSGAAQELIGVDTLIVGSLTEFGRAVTGESGFLTSSKKQQAKATIDIRLIDVKTGQVIRSITGTGVASTESSSMMGFGGVAGYDGSINDQAIGAAVNAVVAKLDSYMLEKSWTADVLAYEESIVYISGGRSQGITEGMVLDVYTKGKQVKSQTTGATITLPGKKVASLKIVSLFGETELEEGAAATVISGSIDGVALDALEVKEAIK